MFLKIWQNAQENTYAKVSISLKKRLPQVFSCEFCGVFKKSVFTENLETASESGNQIKWCKLYLPNSYLVIDYEQTINNVLTIFFGGRIC